MKRKGLQSSIIIVYEFSGAIMEMKNALRTWVKAALSEPNALNPFLLIKGIFHILFGTAENMVSRSIKWRFTKIFKSVSLGSICPRIYIHAPMN